MTVWETAAVVVVRKAAFDSGLRLGGGSGGLRLSRGKGAFTEAVLESAGDVLLSRRGNGGQ